MILYKYMSFKAAQAVIGNSSIGFSQFNKLNDPFEGQALCIEPRDGELLADQSNAYRTRLAKHYGILSMTRTPLNALMWSHYGDEHRGAVVGIDVNKAGLNDPSNSVIPAAFGDMIYTSTMPRNYLPPSSIEDLFMTSHQKSSFFEERYELFKNTFLYKDLSWAYEEEVRVVKRIPIEAKERNAFSEKWTVLDHQGRDLFCFPISRDSIIDVYLGDKAIRNYKNLGLSRDEYERSLDDWRNLGIKIHQVRRSEGTWNLELKPE